MSDDKPTIESIKRHAGVAGQISYEASVSYPDEPASSVTFVGSAYGGPVVMVLPSGNQTFVTDSERFGEFGERWVRRFFGQD